MSKSSLKLLTMFFVFLLGVLTASGESWKTSVRLDAANAYEAAPWGRFESYECPAGAVAPWKGERKIFFGNPLEFNFEGLEDGRDCMIKATFLSDGPRELALDTNGTELEAGLNLEKGQPHSSQWIIPSSRLYGGHLTLTINAMSGPNAVIQTLEILTRDGRKLKPGEHKEFKEPTQDELEKLVMPMPGMAPRPTAVEGTSTPILSLDGTWEFSSTGNTGEFKPIQVPGEWKMQGFDVPRGQFARYRKSVSVPADWKGRRMKMRFDAVHAVCRVVVNGSEVGSHEGGMVPFELDVTDAVRPGEDNVVEVMVQSESVADSVGCISQYAAHQVGGILRKVAMIALPDLHVASDNSRTTLDGADAVFHYEANIANAGDSVRPVVLTAALKDANGREVVSRKIPVEAVPGKSTGVEFTLPVKKANLWTSETPYLYTLVCTLSEKGKPLSRYERKIGLRTVAVSGNRLLVNGSPVKLLAVNHHEVHPLRGRSLTPELCRKDAELYKAAGVNTVRTSHYPPSEEFLQACDELGLFVESESAVCWIQHGASPVWRRWNYRNPDYLPYLLRPTLDQMAANRHHPSIIMWSLGNESVWSCLWEKVLEVAKRYESSRPLVFHDQCWGGYNNAGSHADIANYHYPSENNPDEWSKTGRPVWFGEYAHLQCYNRRELATDPGIREDWSRPLQRMVDLMWDQPGCLGGALWSGIDDVFHLPDGNLCGYGHWGPIDGWRRAKPEYHGMRMAYTPFRVLGVRADSGKPVCLDVQNRQNFLNLRDNRITWSCKGKTGVIRADIAPHARGEITLGSGFRKGDEVTLSVKDPSGREIAREVITIPGGENRENLSSDGKIASMTLVSNGVKIHGIEVPLPVPMVLDINDSGGSSGPAGSTLANQIDPYTPVEIWTWKSDGSYKGAGRRWTGDGAWGSGELEFIPRKGGSMLVRYAVTVNQDVNPRQWGLVWTLPREFDRTEWDRKAHWSWYPEDQIGRPRGTAQALPVVREWVEEPGKEPRHAWKDDANALGCNDFIATKMNIRRVLMKNEQGRCFAFRPASDTAPQALRAWVSPEGVRVLMAGFNTGGADHFFATHYSGERRPLKKGDTIRSEFIISGAEMK